MHSLTVQTLGYYESLEALLSALTSRTSPMVDSGACVLVHPSLVVDLPLVGFLRLRDRLGAVGVHLVVTPAVAPDAVELRRYLPAPGEPTERPA